MSFAGWIFVITVLVCRPVDAGMGPPPGNIYQHLFGTPCECRGGIWNQAPSSWTQTADCVTKVAYLRAEVHQQIGGFHHPEWVCVNKPKINPPGPEKTLSNCSTTCTYTSAVHVSCYETASICVYKGQQYFEARLTETRLGEGVGVTFHFTPFLFGQGGIKSRLQLAGCQGKVPDLIYHPLVLPKSQLPDLDVNTWDIFKTTFFSLNNSDPTLASDCWLCMTTGVVMPVAVPINATISDDETCQPGLPFKVQPMGTFTECLLGMMQNNAYDVDVGVTSFGNCPISTAKKYSSPTPALCPPNGTVFMCGGNSAFPQLPANWTGGCVLALLLPDITIVPGDEPLPIPSLDTLVRRHRRAIQALPLLATLGMTAAVGTGTAGLGTAIHSYRRLSQQLIDDVQTLSGTIRDLQDQIDSLAEVVLQNRRGLDLLTANQGGICLALGERCCFYANKSGIVRTKIKELQEDLEKRRKELENPLWTGMNGFLPYLLPLLGPLLGLLLIATLGPCIANRITQFIKDQINILTSKPIQVHYQRLEMDDTAQEVYLQPIRR
uniref:syncytin-1-like n=1 Tax=Callospermophilus lateralis TaxID=76772 RepID=UPI004038927A